MKTLKELETGKNLNIQLTRFIASWLVIFSHSYTLTVEEDGIEPLKMLTGGRIYASSLAVIIFFLIGGYYISKSAERIGDAKRFFAARLKKLWLPLAAVTVVTALLGVFISSHTPGQYFGNMQTYKYLLNGLFVPVHQLPGVFEHNIYANVVNGALWTMPVELACYVVCYVMYKLKFLTKKYYKFTIPVAVMVALAMIIFEKQCASFHVIIRACLAFYIGMGIYVYRDKIRISKPAGLICLLLFVVTLLLKQPDVGIYLFLPYVMLVLWFGFGSVNERISSLGNLSFGMYLVAFPVSQTIMHFFDNDISIWLNCLLTTVIAMILGALIYHFLEKPRSR